MNNFTAKNKKIQKDGRAIVLMAFFAVIFMAISILPFVYLSFFDYANGDDFNYGWMTHQAWLSTGSILAVLQSACAVVRNTWYSWQGTWSSVFLFSLQPGIWNEKAYGLTVWIALFCIMGGSYYFLYIIFRKIIQMSMPLFLILWSLLEILTLQFIPNIKTAVFWYTSVAHYIIPLGAALLVLGWTIQWLYTGKKRYYFGILIFMSYLGGAGYPLVVLAGVGVFFIMVCFAFRSREDRNRVKRAFFLLIPIIIEGIGFIVSAISPGNKVRGGEDFGFSLTRAFDVVCEGFANTLRDILDSSARPELFIPIIIIAIFTGFTYHPREEKVNKILSPWIVIIFCFITIAAIRMPALYAAVDVSSGVPDTEFILTVLAVYLSLIYTICWIKQIIYLKKELNINNKTVNINRNATIWICLSTVILLLGTAFLTRHSLKNTSDYLCIDFISSGSLADFETQMQERLAILNDNTNLNPVVPEMNNEQGPFMHMALLDDPNAFTNRVTSEYYGKNSVIAVPREEYMQMYRNGRKISN